MFFPEYRARRLRRNATMRRMVRETFLRTDDLIYPMFSAFGQGIKKEIPSMPGIYQQSIEHIVAEAKEVHELGIPAVILFGIPEAKDAVGQDAYSETGIIQETIRAIKEAVPELTGDHRRLPVRVHRPRPLRRDQGRRRRQRRHPASCSPPRPSPTPAPAPTSSPLPT